MSEQIIEMTEWLQTPVGQYLLAWECSQMDQAVADLFGYHAIQLGMPELHGLRANRMPHRWRAELGKGTFCEGVAASVVCDGAALPFPAASLDLVLMPHTLEHSGDPHATLREVERVLVPEGRVVIAGLNLTSFWGFRQKRARFFRKMGLGSLYLPESGEFIGYWRLRDWLRLLGFEVESVAFGCYVPAVEQPQWLRRFAWVERAGARWWPIFGAAYCVVAVKRVRGVRLLEAKWKPVSSGTVKPVSVVNQISVGQRNNPSGHLAWPHDKESFD